MQLAHKSRLAELEQRTNAAEEGRRKSEAEYDSLRGAVKSMSAGWKMEIEWLKADLGKVENKWKGELAEQKNRYLARTSLTFVHLDYMANMLVENSARGLPGKTSRRAGDSESTRPAVDQPKSLREHIHK